MLFAVESPREHLKTDCQTSFPETLIQYNWGRPWESEILECFPGNSDMQQIGFGSPNDLKIHGQVRWSFYS